MTSTKNKAIHATAWASVEHIGQQGIMFVVSIVLARLVNPSEFGLIAMTMIFTGIANVFINAGFPDALTQRLRVTNIEKSTVFWYNLIIGTFIFVIIYFSAKYVSNFFNQPRLTSILRWSSLVYLINCFGVVQWTMLQKQLRFRERSIVTLISILISGVISIFMAVKGYGVWALVVQNVVMVLVRVCGLWIISEWRPGFIFSIRAFKQMFAFGHNLMFSLLIRTIFDNIYNVIIGKTSSLTNLGYFYRGKRFSFLASQIPTEIISRVSFPILSKAQKDLKKLAQRYLKFLSINMALVVPVLVVIIATAPNFIYVLIGGKWLPSVPYLRLTCISSIFFPIHMLSYIALAASGQSRISLKVEIIKYLLVSLSISLTIKSGIIMLLIGEMVAICLSAIVSLYYIQKYLKITWINIFHVLGPIFICSGFMLVGVMFFLNREFSVVALLCKFCVGAIIYLTGLFLFRFPILFEGSQMIKEKYF